MSTIQQESSSFDPALEGTSTKIFLPTTRFLVQIDSSMNDGCSREREYSHLPLLSEALPLRRVWTRLTRSLRRTGWLVLERPPKRRSRQNSKAVLLTAEDYSRDNTMLLPLGGIYGAINSAGREGGRCFLARSKAKAFYLCSHTNKFSIKYVLQGKLAKCVPQRTH